MIVTRIAKASLTDEDNYKALPVALLRTVIHRLWAIEHGFNICEYRHGDDFRGTFRAERYAAKWSGSRRMQKLARQISTVRLRQDAFRQTNFPNGVLFANR